MIIKARSTAVDINATASTISGAVLVSVYNTSSVLEEIIVSGTGYNIKIGPGERMLIEKEITDELDATGAAASIWANAVAYNV